MQNAKSLRSNARIWKGSNLSNESKSLFEAPAADHVKKILNETKKFKVWSKAFQRSNIFLKEVNTDENSRLSARAHFSSSFADEKKTGERFEMERFLICYCLPSHSVCFVLFDFSCQGFDRLTSFRDLCIFQVAIGLQ